MSSDVVLTAALRQNLLSLQSTQDQIDQTQFRLATGRRINSALDNPQNFFAAQSLTNRASDLSGLLDGIGQSIRVIEAADNGVTALTSLVEQADSIANQALDALAEATGNSVATGTATGLGSVTDLTALAGISTGDKFTVQVGSAQEQAITITDGLGVNGLLAELNDIDNLEASVNSSGQLEIRTTNGEGLRLANLSGTALTSTTGLGFTDVSAATGSPFTIGTLAVATTEAVSVAGLDSNDAFTISVGGAAATTITVTNGTVGDLVSDINAVSGISAELDSNNALVITSDNGAEIDFANDTGVAGAAILGSTFDATIELDPRDQGTNFLVGSSLSVTLTNDSTDAVAARTDTFDSIEGFVGTFGGDDDLVITVDGGTSVTVDLNQSISDFVDQINNNANGTVSSNLAGLTATYNETTGELKITTDSTVDAFTLNTASLEAGENTAFGFGNGALDKNGGSSGAINFAPSTGATDSTVAGLAADYDEVRNQINQLVTDTGFGGVNLLNGDDLITTFNEGRTSTLTTDSVTFDALGLGINQASFGSSGTINTAITEVRNALATLRDFGSTLSNDLAVIQTRQSFTEQTINTLESGADDLTIADQNAEGARLLSLQTRQQLGTTSLALAAQSQQSVLRLF